MTTLSPVERVKNKPHIVFVGSFWRVSASSTRSFKGQRKLYNDAHTFANYLNHKEEGDVYVKP